MYDADYSPKRRNGTQKGQPTDRMFVNLLRSGDDFETGRHAPAITPVKASRGQQTAEPGKGLRSRNELEDLFDDIESASFPRRSWGGWVLGLLASAWSFWRREREIRRSIVALSEMDDRTLRDIGIEDRVQVPPVIRYGR